GPPFDRADADVVLCSSDNVTFRVHEAILSVASPVFETIFSLPQPQISTDGSPPVINPAENGAVLANLPTAIYPVVPVVPRSPSDFVASIVAAEKYEMAVPSHRLDQHFANSRVVQIINGRLLYRIYA
ncbi:hypothetical protein H4582DRAFT_1811860, partial [Lactarius indigo]